MGLLRQIKIIVESIVNAKATRIYEDGSSMMFDESKLKL